MRAAPIVSLKLLTLAKSGFDLGMVLPGFSSSIISFRSSLACVLAAFVEVWLVLVILMCPVVLLTVVELLSLLLELELVLSAALCSVLSTCLTTRLFVKSSMGSSVPSSGSASASNLLLFSCDLVVTIWSPVSGISLSAGIWVNSGYLIVSLGRSACPERFFNLELLEMRLKS